MNEIGSLLRESRESAGVSLEEASTDLEIKELILENIEDGNIGCFKDIFILKDYIYDYAKYLGLDPEKTIDEFNEYLFEYTSKIPVKEIEKAVKEKEQEEPKEKRVASPYTQPKKQTKKPFILIYILLAVMIVVAVIWSVKQITINNEVAKTISYID